MNGNEDLPDDHFWDADEAEQESNSFREFFERTKDVFSDTNETNAMADTFRAASRRSEVKVTMSSGMYDIEIECLGCGTINHLNVTSAGDVDRAYCAGCNSRLFRETDESDTGNDEDEEDEWDDKEIDDSEVPAGAAFFGIMGTKRYYPVESIHEFFSSSDTKQLHGELVELVYFVSEEEAEARGFAPAQGIRCPDCGRLNLIGETYCEECGCPLDATEEYFEDEEDGEGNTEPEEDYEDEHKYDNDLSSVVLGRGINLKTDEEEDVVIGDVERRGGVYILGQPRTGKSTSLVNMIVQDSTHGHGICFIDPHGDGIIELLKRLPENRLDDVILLDPLDEDYAFGINLFACKNPKNRKQISRTINYVLQVFGKLFTESGNLQDAVMLYGTLLNTTILLVYNALYTLAEVNLILVNRDAAAKLIERIGEVHDDQKEWWLAYNRMKFTEKEDVSGSTQRRLQPFLADEHIRHIVGQSKSTLDFREIMDTGKILLVKLPREFPELSKLVGSLIIGQLLTAAYSRDDTPEADRRQFCLYCDEFQNFATPDFAQLFTQTGKYHLAPTVAHQERVGQFAEEKKILGATSAAAIKVLYQTTVHDADEHAPEFAKAPEPARVEVLEKERIETMEVIDGEEPVKTYEHEVVKHLLHHEQKDTWLAAFARDYLQELHLGSLKKRGEVTRDVADPRDKYNADAWGYVRNPLPPRHLDYTVDIKNRLGNMYDPEVIPEVLLDLNECLFNGMVKKGGGRWFPEVKLMKSLAGFFGFETVYEILYDTKKPDRIAKERQKLLAADFLYSPKDAWQFKNDEVGRKEFVKTALAALEEALLDFLMSVSSHSRLNLQNTLKSADINVIYCNPAQVQNRALDVLEQMDKTIFDYGGTHPAIDQATYKEVFTKELAKQAVDVYLPAVLYYSSYYVFGSLWNPSETHSLQAYKAHILARFEECMKIYHEQFQAYLRFRNTLLLAELALSQNPIMTTGSGLYQPRKRQQLVVRPEKTLTLPQRTEADMVNEMARELTNLPRFTAYCKIVRAVAGKQEIVKYKLYPDPLERVEDEKRTLDRNTAYIMERMHDETLGYYRKRERVEQEIAARRATLKARELKQKGQTTLDEDED